MGGRRITYKFVKLKFEEEGYELLSTDYISSDAKLNYRCPNGHIHSIRWDDFKQGQRCGRCKGNIQVTYENVQQAFVAIGYTLLTKSYVNNYSYLDYKCTLGHTHQITWQNFRLGKGCPTCAGLLKFSYDEIKNILEKENYSLISKDYENVDKKLVTKCPRGHEQP